MIEVTYEGPTLMALGSAAGEWRVVLTDGSVRLEMTPEEASALLGDLSRVVGVTAGNSEIAKRLTDVVE